MCFCTIMTHCSSECRARFLLVEGAYGFEFKDGVYKYSSVSVFFRLSLSLSLSIANRGIIAHFSLSLVSRYLFVVFEWYFRLPGSRSRMSTSSFKSLSSVVCVTVCYMLAMPTPTAAYEVSPTGGWGSNPPTPTCAEKLLKNQKASVCRVWCMPMPLSIIIPYPGIRPPAAGRAFIGLALRRPRACLVSAAPDILR